MLKLFGQFKLSFSFTNSNIQFSHQKQNIVWFVLNLFANFIKPRPTIQRRNILYVSKSINKLLKLSAKNETNIIIIVRSHMRLDDILEANPTKLSSIKFTRKIADGERKNRKLE